MTVVAAIQTDGWLHSHSVCVCVCYSLPMNAFVNGFAGRSCKNPFFILFLGSTKISFHP